VHDRQCEFEGMMELNPLLLEYIEGVIGGCGNTAKLSNIER